MRDVEQVGIGLRGRWLRSAVEWWGRLLVRVGEGVSRRRVSRASFIVVVVVTAVVGVAVGKQHGGFCVWESELREERLVVKFRNEVINRVRFL